MRNSEDALWRQGITDFDMKKGTQLMLLLFVTKAGRVGSINQNHLFFERTRVKKHQLARGWPSKCNVNGVPLTEANNCAWQLLHCSLSTRQGYFLQLIGV